MQKSTLLMLGATMLLAAAYANELSGAWKPVPANYTIFSGELSGRLAPTAKDRKLAIAIDGKAAKEIFNSIGGEKNDTCRGTKGVKCTLSSDGKDYRCWTGVNLKTGEGIRTVSC